MKILVNTNKPEFVISDISIGIRFKTNKYEAFGTQTQYRHLGNYGVSITKAELEKILPEKEINNILKVVKKDYDEI